MTPFPRIAPGLAAAALVAALWAQTAAAADFEEYANLAQQAAAAHQQLENASPDLLPALRENALERDMAVIQWLDNYLSSDEFSTLPPDQQALAYQDRYRNEYNASRLLIALDRCEEARDRVRSLLDSGIDDPELRPRLTATYEEAVTCVNRPRTASLVVDAQPANADLLVDGEFVGLADSPHDVALGDHTLLVRASGFQSQQLSFTAANEGEDVHLGPIVLAAASAGTSPTWYEWTLWGAGAVGITAGILFMVEAGDHQSQIDNPPAGFVVADPQGEASTVDQLHLAGYLCLGVGIAAAVAGTVLYIRGRHPEERPVAWGPVWWAGGGGAFMRIAF